MNENNSIEKYENETEITFERMKGEGQTAFKYFCLYRDMGNKRSYRRVAHDAGVSTQLIFNLAQKWHWQDRIKLWIDEVDKVKRESYLKEVQEMAKRHAQHSMAFQRVLTIPVEAILKKIKSGDISYQDFLNLPVAELFDKTLKSAQLFSSIVDIERKSRGEPTELIKQDVQQDNTQEIKVILPIIPNNQLPDEND
jgi:hypothetical protein